MARWLGLALTPARIARMSSANAPASMPCVVGPMTSAGVTVPVTVPCCGHGGLLPPPQRNAETPPDVKLYDRM